MTTDHVVKAYDEELRRLDETIAKMGALAATQIDAALKVLEARDSAMARTIFDRDEEVDGLERDVDTFTVRLLALRQPMADDLRGIVSALRISIDLERMADYAVSIARRAMDLRDGVPTLAVERIQRIGEILQGMLEEVRAAYRDRDAERARDAWRRDDQVDSLYLELLNILHTRMVDDPGGAQACTHLLFVAKSLERIGDHLTNVCEHIVYRATGQVLDASHPGALCENGAAVIPLRRSRDTRPGPDVSDS